MRKQEKLDLDEISYTEQGSDNVIIGSPKKEGNVSSDQNITTKHIDSTKPSDYDEITARELVLILIAWWSYLLSKWIVIVIFVLLGGVGGVIYAISQKPLYTAEITFVLEGGSQGGLDGYAGLASQFGINMGNGGGEGVFEGENFLALMRSRLMIEKALLTPVKVENKVITLAEFFISINRFRDQWKDNPKMQNIRFMPGVDPLGFSKEQNSLINNFHSTLIQKNLFIGKQDKKSNIISLRVTSEDELFSKYLAEVLVKEVSTFYVETKTKKSTDNIRILQHQTDSIRRALNASMVSAAYSIDANPNPNMARQILRVPAQRRQGDAQVNQAILSQLVQNLEIAKMTLRKETPLVQVIDTPTLPLGKTGFGKLKGLIFGGIIAGFLIVAFLILRRLLLQLTMPNNRPEHL